MTSASPPETPRRLLFACNLNTIRSPMAEGLARRALGEGVEIASCGVWEGGYLDPFMVQVMQEVGVAMDGHEPQTFDQIAGRRFDVIVALTPESRTRAEDVAALTGSLVEFWPLPDPTDEVYSRDARLESYRSVRNAILEQIEARFHTAERAP